LLLSVSAIFKRQLTTTLGLARHGLSQQDKSIGAAQSQRSQIAVAYLTEM
jgi:hypothetical protein